MAERSDLDRQIVSGVWSHVGTFHFDGVWNLGLNDLFGSGTVPEKKVFRWMSLSRRSRLLFSINSDVEICGVGQNFMPNLKRNLRYFGASVRTVRSW